MLTKSLFIGAAVAAAIAVPAQAAVLVNAGFETGDLAGWQAPDGNVNVVMSSDDYAYGSAFGRQFVAEEGAQFAELTAGDADEYVTLSQSFTLTNAARISFSAAFLRFDELSDNGDGTFAFNDDAYIRIYSATTNALVFNSSVLALGDDYSTPWSAFTSGLLGSGDYVFEAGVRNADEGGPDFSSKLLVDNLSIAVPEPSTWAMMLLGFGALGGALRRRRAGLALA